MDNQKKRGPRSLSYSMKQLMEDMKNDDETGRELEQAFRRGYAHGSATVITAMLEMLRRGISLEVAVAMCEAFECDINQWRRGELGSTPPDFIVGAYIKRVYEEKHRQAKEDDYDEYSDGIEE